MTPTRLQSDNPGLSNSPEQAGWSQSKSDKIAIILDTSFSWPLGDINNPRNGFLIPEKLSDDNSILDKGLKN